MTKALMKLQCYLYVKCFFMKFIFTKFIKFIIMYIFMQFLIFMFIFMKFIFRAFQKAPRKAPPKGVIFDINKSRVTVTGLYVYIQYVALNTTIKTDLGY